MHASDGNSWVMHTEQETFRCVINIFSFSDVFFASAIQTVHWRLYLNVVFTDLGQRFFVVVFFTLIFSSGIYSEERYKWCCYVLPRDVFYKRDKTLKRDDPALFS